MTRVVAPDNVADSHSRPDERDRPTVATLLRTFRHAAGLSQAELAERADMSTGAIAALEQGLRRAPYRSTLDGLAAALDLTGEQRDLLYGIAKHNRGRRAAAPPARPLKHNFPHATTSFIERDEVQRIQLLADEHRCVTVVGPGGIGKTRTVIEAADRLAVARDRSAYFVDLSSLHDETKVMSEVCAIVGSTVEELAERNVLLVLDNCEHIIGGVARLTADILAECPGVSVLATSRERMGLSGEIVFRLPSLRLPDDDVTTADAASGYAAVALFLQRARHAGARLTLDLQQVHAVVDICTKLDGVPLAIELAAARLPAMGLVTLRDRLADALRLPGSVDLPARQRTLEETIAWSFDLLSFEERWILMRVSVFAGSFVLEAAEAVCSDDRIARDDVLMLVTSLIEKSLINVTLSGDRAYYRLLESIRTFGLRRLRQQGAYEDAARRHAQWYAEKADAYLALGRGTASAFINEIDDPRSAIEWCLESGAQSDIIIAARIALGTEQIWSIKARQPALRRHLIDILERLDDTEANYRVISRLWKARVDTFDHHDRELIDEATPFLERAGDAAAVATLNAQLAVTQARAADFDAANVAYARAAAYFDADAGRRKGKFYHYFVNVGAWIAFSQHEIVRARTQLVRLLAAMDAEGLPAEQRGDTLQLLAEIEDAAGNPDAAIALARKTLDFYGTTGVSKNIGITMANLCGYLVRSGADLVEAERYGEQALRRLAAAQEQGPHWDTVIAAQNLAATLAQRGRLHVAAVILGFVESEYRRSNYKLSQTDQANFDVLVATVRSRLPEDQLDQLRADGAALGFTEAIDILLLAVRSKPAL